MHVNRNYYETGKSYLLLAVPLQLNAKNARMWDFCHGSVVKSLLLQETWALSLVGELRSHMPCAVAKKKKIEKVIFLKEQYGLTKHPVPHLQSPPTRVSSHIRAIDSVVNITTLSMLIMMIYLPCDGMLHFWNALK